MDHVAPSVATVGLAELGEQLSSLRLRTAAALREMEQSLLRHGQLVAVVCSRQASGIEILDGFKRLIGARSLGWTTLRAEIHDVCGPAAKLLLWRSNARQELSELEEAWLVHALYRDDRLTQPQIAQLLGRHKSWVYRRMVLAEGLADEVTADVRLGLVSTTCARELGRLPRGNQPKVAQVIARRGLTTRQTTRLIDQLLAAADDRVRAAVLSDAERTSPPVVTARRTAATPGDAMIADAAALAARATRLHTRLLERPLASLGPEVAGVVAGRLGELGTVLAALCAALPASTASSREVRHGA